MLKVSKESYTLQCCLCGLEKDSQDFSYEKRKISISETDPQLAQVTRYSDGKHPVCRESLFCFIRCIKQMLSEISEIQARQEKRGEEATEEELKEVNDHNYVVVHGHRVKVRL